MDSQTLPKENRVKTSVSQIVFLVLFGIFLALFAAEVAARILYDPAAPSSKHFKSAIHETVPDLNLLYKLSPGAETFKDGVSHKVNSHGFRDREFSVEKTPGTKRVLFLGDSVVYGYEAPLELSVPKMLEQRLREKGKKIEVLNFGVLGYETRQDVEFFKLLGKKFKPDVVILGYTLNDSRFASITFTDFGDHGKWRVASPQLHWHERIPNFFYRNMRLLQYLDREKKLFDGNKNLLFYLRGEKDIWHYVRDKNIVHQDAQDSPYRKLRREIEGEAVRLGTNPDNFKEMLEFAGYSENEMFTSHWNISKEAVRELKKISEEEGFELKTAIFPYLWCLDKYALTPLHKFLKNEFTEMGIPVLDSLEALQKAAVGNEDKMTTDGVHFMAYGSSSLADFLAENLEN